jgi:hypothetical protein
MGTCAWLHSCCNQAIVRFDRPVIERYRDFAHKTQRTQSCLQSTGTFVFSGSTDEPRIHQHRELSEGLRQQFKIDGFVKKLSGT